MDQILRGKSPRQHGDEWRLDPSVPLKSKMESFAQARAAGFSQNEAYVRAGYMASRAKAHALDKKEHVRTRINYLVERRCATPAPGSPSKTSEILPPAEVTPQWVMAQLLDVARRGRAKTLTAAEVSALTKLYQTIGKELGMWQTPYTPPDFNEDINPLSHLKKEQLLAYMVKEIGYDAAAAVIERFKPRAVASPNGAGNGSGNGAAH